MLLVDQALTENLVNLCFAYEEEPFASSSHCFQAPTCLLFRLRDRAQEIWPVAVDQRSQAQLAVAGRVTFLAKRQLPSFGSLL